MKLPQDDEMGVMKDWRKALRSPPAYRIVNRTLKQQTQFVIWVSLIGLIILILVYIFPGKSDVGKINHVKYKPYNHTYPLTRPINSNGIYTFRIGIIADMDTDSKSLTQPHTWISYYKKGYLSYTPQKDIITVSWDKSDSIQLSTNFALKDRGMELSELVIFDGRLLTFDDRTGMIFELQNEKAIPWVLLTDGDGSNVKGFKSEWATVKGEELYVGSMGKEWTTASGDFQNRNPQYIKIITTRGEISHIKWIDEYDRIRRTLGITWPGYMIHESGVWSNIHKKWFFLPRRCSKESYNETLDELRGCSVLICSDENFRDITVINIPNSGPSRGFSSFKFVPNSHDSVIVALRTEELFGKTSTYITAFKTNGQLLLPDTYISNLKFEGLEFI